MWLWVIFIVRCLLVGMAGLSDDCSRLDLGSYRFPLARKGVDAR